MHDMIPDSDYSRADIDAMAEAGYTARHAADYSPPWADLSSDRQWLWRRAVLAINAARDEIDGKASTRAYRLANTRRVG